LKELRKALQSIGILSVPTDIFNCLSWAYVPNTASEAKVLTIALSRHSAETGNPLS